MEEKFQEIAQRLKGLREMLDISVEDIAAAIGVTKEDYLAHESGECDFSFTFLFKAAQFLDVDITDILTGESPKLSVYTVVRKGKGLPIERRKEFQYTNLAYLFKNRMVEPFLVTAKYDPEQEKLPIHLSYHEGQEVDYILSGKLKFRINNSEEILCPGDTVYYDSSNGHGMIAVDGEDAVFLAFVLNPRK